MMSRFASHRVLSGKVADPRTTMSMPSENVMRGMDDIDIDAIHSQTLDEWSLLSEPTDDDNVDTSVPIIKGISRDDSSEWKPTRPMSISPRGGVEAMASPRFHSPPDLSGMSPRISSPVSSPRSLVSSHSPETIAGPGSKAPSENAKAKTTIPLRVALEGELANSIDLDDDLAAEVRTALYFPSDARGGSGIRRPRRDSDIGAIQSPKESPRCSEHPLPLVPPSATSSAPSSPSNEWPTDKRAPVRSQSSGSQIGIARKMSVSCLRQNTAKSAPAKGAQRRATEGAPDDDDANCIAPVEATASKSPSSFRRRATQSNSPKLDRLPMAPPPPAGADASTTVGISPLSPPPPAGSDATLVPAPDSSKLTSQNPSSSPRPLSGSVSPRGTAGTAAPPLIKANTMAQLPRESSASAHPLTKANTMAQLPRESPAASPPVHPANPLQKLARSSSMDVGSRKRLARDKKARSKKLDAREKSKIHNKIEGWFTSGGRMEPSAPKKGKEKKPSAACLEISGPTQMVHRIHVDHEFQWSGIEKAEEAFEVLNRLGDGAFGSVFRAQHKETTFECAIKAIRTGENDAKARLAISKEVNILKRCKHENVVRYYGCCMLPDQIWILMDFCELGAVKDLMKKVDFHLDEEQISAIMCATLKGLSYLHQDGIVHRDMKAANLLMSADGAVKIADFGVSLLSGGGTSGSLNSGKSLIGTPYYMAPEVLGGSVDDGEAADVWALGITAIELAEGEPPRFKLNVMRAMFLISTDDPPTLTNPAQWSEEFQDFLRCCLNKDPKKRLKPIELLAHPFIISKVSRHKDSLQALVAAYYTFVDAPNPAEPGAGASESDKKKGRTYRRSLFHKQTDGRVKVGRVTAPGKQVKASAPQTDKEKAAEAMAVMKSSMAALRSCLKRLDVQGGTTDDGAAQSADAASSNSNAMTVMSATVGMKGIYSSAEEIVKLLSSLNSNLEKSERSEAMLEEELDMAYAKQDANKLKIKELTESLEHFGKSKSESDQLLRQLIENLEYRANIAESRVKELEMKEEGGDFSGTGGSVTDEGTGTSSETTDDDWREYLHTG
eukprot:TRINITY_DN615_c0_g3_i1.p1 TRINITY_DN615_c0_g3~~TRINITY_DN615_c0_g3_i1.p1  ORF type:complete len:1066 (+),score=245.92 TRINITY_DN615_c0_g3_i1:384-3581(+)